MWTALLMTLKYLQIHLDLLQKQLSQTYDHWATVCKLIVHHNHQIENDWNLVVIAFNSYGSMADYVKEVTSSNKQSSHFWI